MKTEILPTGSGIPGTSRALINYVAKILVIGLIEQAMLSRVKSILHSTCPIRRRW